MFVQYRPGVILGDFVDQITEGRIKSLEENNSQLALTFKTVGNRFKFNKYLADSIIDSIYIIYIVLIIIYYRFYIYNLYIIFWIFFNIT